MSEEIAQILMDARNQLDRLWGRPDLPPYVGLVAGIIDHAIVKCLQEGGWTVFRHPDKPGCGICRLRELPT
jgi:hypothetical protein